jgi:3-mercaptopropionate dioxygenase
MTNHADAAIDSIAPLREFVLAVSHIIDQAHSRDAGGASPAPVEPLKEQPPRESVLSEAQIVQAIRPALAALIANDHWLPAQFRKPHPEYYQQYLLYCDPYERFSVQSFVWGPGQSTPIHDHTVWGLVGVLSGAERCQRYTHDPQTGALLKQGGPVTLKEKEIDLVSPSVGDIHTVANALSDRPSISIHVYGANIGGTARHVFDPVSGAVKPFVSGYSSTVSPNLWDRSAAVRADLAS